MFLHGFADFGSWRFAINGYKKGVKTAKSFPIVQISRFATLGFYADNHTSTVMGTSVPVPYRFAYSSLVALLTNHIPSDSPEGHIL